MCESVVISILVLVTYVFDNTQKENYCIVWPTIHRVPDLFTYPTRSIMNYQSVQHTHRLPERYELRQYHYAVLFQRVSFNVNNKYYTTCNLPYLNRYIVIWFIRRPLRPTEYENTSRFKRTLGNGSQPFWCCCPLSELYDSKKFS